MDCPIVIFFFETCLDLYCAYLIALLFLFAVGTMRPAWTMPASPSRAAAVRPRSAQRWPQLTAWTSPQTLGAAAWVEASLTSTSQARQLLVPHSAPPCSPQPCPHAALHPHIWYRLQSVGVFSRRRDAPAIRTTACFHPRWRPPPPCSNPWGYTSRTHRCPTSHRSLPSHNSYPLLCWVVVPPYSPRLSSGHRSHRIVTTAHREPR